MYLASQLKSKFDAAQCNLNTNSTFVTWCLHRRDANNLSDSDELLVALASLLDFAQWQPMRTPPVATTATQATRTM